MIPKQGDIARINPEFKRLFLKRYTAWDFGDGTTTVDNLHNATDVEITDSFEEGTRLHYVQWEYEYSFYLNKDGTVDGYPDIKEPLFILAIGPAERDKPCSCEEPKGAYIGASEICVKCKRPVQPGD